MANKAKQPLKSNPMPKSLAEEVDEAWKYFWAKRGMPEPPTNTNMIFDDFTGNKDKEDTEKPKD